MKLLPNQLNNLRLQLVILNRLASTGKVNSCRLRQDVYQTVPIYRRCYSCLQTQGGSLGIGGTISSTVNGKYHQNLSSLCRGYSLMQNKKKCVLPYSEIWEKNIMSICRHYKRCFSTVLFNQTLKHRHLTSGVLKCINPYLWYSYEKRGLKSGRDKAGQTQDEYSNPIDRLQQYVAVPLLPEKDYIFKPSEKEVSEAQKLFVPSDKHKIEFLKSALFDDQLPEYDLPEVAFIGRSNVGKSSLIQMLLNQTDVTVRISKKPGHTKMLNFFQVGGKFTLVDMPGYGFNMPSHYASSVEDFLYSRKKLCRTFILVDSTVGVTEVDVVGLNMLEEFNIPYAVVMTKIDKTKPSNLIRSFMTVLKYRDSAKKCFQQPFLISSKNGEGVPLLQTFIAYVTGNMHIASL